MVRSRGKLQTKMWIATVTLQTPNDKYPDNNSRKNSAQNKDRMAALLRIISSLSTQVSGDGIILFPGGWFHNGKKPAKSLLPFIETSITPELQKISAHIIVSFGVDGSLDDGGYDGDQVAVVIDKNGIIAAGRKFQAVTQNESQRIFLAPDYWSPTFKHINFIR